MYNSGGGGGTEFDSKGATDAIADLNPDDIESISVLTALRPQHSTAVMQRTVQ